jgi:two-component system sensor histidine kinase YesM
MKYLVKWFMDLRIAFKVMTCYFVMLLLFLIFGAICYKQLNNLTTNKVRQMSIETSKSVSNNLDFLFNTLNNQTIIIMSSQVVQNALNEGNPSNSYTFQKQVSNYFADSMNFDEVISSIYVFDNYGDEYYVDNSSQKGITLSLIKKASWYKQLIGINGKYLLKINGGGTFSSGVDYVSMIRVINNVDTQQSIGFMIVNVSTAYINQSIIQGNNANDMQIVLRDENKKDIVDTNKDFTSLINSDLVGNGGSFIKKVRGEDYIISILTDDFNWKIACITPFNELTKQVGTYNAFLLIFVLANGILFIATFALVSLLISSPIHKLAISMKTVENGDLKEIDIKTGSDEIGMLKDVYNLMIRRIELLFQNIIKDQAIKRKKELEVLQTQIKPHFLYNSFDAISSLALSGDNKQVYNLVIALGTFYKSFLNSGNEEITVENELEIVESYLTIQKIRFGDKFIIDKEIDERTFGYKMPRLTLQPLVENALNHGIRGRRGQGILTIKALYYEDFIQLIVEDNGIGMDEEKVSEILSGSSKGIGLGATIERLNLYFNTTDILDIKSQIGHGTAITITIPKNQEI